MKAVGIIAAFIVSVFMLSGCQYPMTWDEMHGWMPRGDYLLLHPGLDPVPFPVRIPAPVETRDC